MKKLFTLLILLSIALCQPLVVSAQTSQDEPIPGAPRFTIKGADGKFWLGVSGRIRATVGYDFGSPIDNDYAFVTSAIPMTTPAGDKTALHFSAHQSNIVFRAGALPGTKNEVGMYLRIDFTTANYTPRFYQGYVTYRGLKAGYDFTLFCDINALLPTIDFEGPNAFAGVQNVVFDYSHYFKNGWGLGIGLERPVESVTYSASTKNVNQRVPNIPVFVRKSWDNDGSWIRLSGMLRNIQYRDLTDNRNRNAVGFGVTLSGVQQLGTPKLKTYWQACAGKGISNFYQDLYGGGLDLTPSATKQGELQTVGSWGAYAGLEYYFLPNLHACAGYSHLRTYMDAYAGGDTPYADQLSYTQYAVANLWWNINDLFTCGVEYLYGRRVNYSKAQAHTSRVQVMAQVAF